MPLPGLTLRDILSQKCRMGGGGECSILNLKLDKSNMYFLN